MLYTIFGDFMITTIYYIRHAEPEKDIKAKINGKTEQDLNESICLSSQGELQAEKLSELCELQNLNQVWSSNYKRALDTAKFIANKNNKEIIIEPNLGERKLGDLEKLKLLGQTKKRSYTQEQLLDENLKNEVGESHKEVKERLYNITLDILTKNKGKTCAVISHGAAIKFLLMNWCNLDESLNISYNGKIVVKETIDYTGIIKLEFENDKLINIQNVEHN